MDYPLMELMKRANIKSHSTLYTYIERPEFSHIKRVRKPDNKVIYTNVRLVDLLRLNLLTHRRSLTFKQKAQLNKLIKKCKANNGVELDHNMFVC